MFMNQLQQLLLVVNNTSLCNNVGLRTKHNQHLLNNNSYRLCNSVTTTMTTITTTSLQLLTGIIVVFILTSRSGAARPTCEKYLPSECCYQARNLNWHTRNKTGDVLSCYMQQSSIHYTLLCIHSSHDTTMTVWKLFTKKKCFTDFRIATPTRTSVSKDIGDSGIRRMNSTLSVCSAGYTRALPRYWSVARCIAFRCSDLASSPCPG